MRMPRSSTPLRASSAESFSLPSVLLMAISTREIALNSIFPGLCKATSTRVLRRSGASTAKIKATVSRRRRRLAPREEGFNFLVRHRLPPVRIEHLDFSSQCPQDRFLASRLFRAHDIHHRHAPATDGHWLAVFDGLNQFRQLVLRVRYADLHGLMIAI